MCAMLFNPCNLPKTRPARVAHLIQSRRMLFYSEHPHAEEFQTNQPSMNWVVLTDGGRPGQDGDQGLRGVQMVWPLGSLGQSVAGSGCLTDSRAQLSPSSSRLVSPDPPPGCSTDRRAPTERGAAPHRQDTCVAPQPAAGQSEHRCRYVSSREQP